MRGISEEKLKEKLSYVGDLSITTRPDVYKELIAECKELNPWQPIDDNTPKDKWIWLYYPQWNTQAEGMFLSEAGVWESDLDDNILTLIGEPTHWQELPPDPEGAEK